MYCSDEYATIICSLLETMSYRMNMNVPYSPFSYASHCQDLKHPLTHSGVNNKRPTTRLEINTEVVSYNPTFNKFAILKRHRPDKHRSQNGTSQIDERDMRC